MPRDPGMIPGPSAAQWETRARLALLAAVVLIAGSLLGITLPPAVPIALGTLGLLALAAWLVLGGRAQRTSVRERDAGYSTTLDVAGYALRHPITGALERDAQTAPDAAQRRRRSFLLDNLRIRPDTWVDRHARSDGD